LYNPCVLKSAMLSIFFLAATAPGLPGAEYVPLAAGRMAGWEEAAQQQPPTQQQPDQPKIKLNYLNVCTPSAEEQAALKSALSRTSGNPAFAEDFEISRGRATVKDEPPAKFVRLRRDFAAQSPMMTAQYSMSSDVETTIETLVLRMRDTKEFYEISMEDRVSAGAASPLSVVATDTPAARIRIERLGKSSIVLARCQGADQSVYEPLFKQASDLMAHYRGAMGLRTAFRTDIGWLGNSVKSGMSPSSHKQP
jgi:hypothetical protein